MLHIVHRDPRQLGLAQSRWTLTALRTTCDWLRLTTASGLCQLLQRLEIRYKRARDYVHSPDPHYEAKRAQIAHCATRVRGTATEVLLYQDEFTYYRQPSLAAAYAAHGSEQAYAYRSYRSNTATRVVAVLNAHTGQVQFRQGARCGIPELVGFYQDVCAAYPAARRLWLAQDNWSIHFHPDVLVSLEPQAFPWPRYVPPNWDPEPSPAAQRRWGHLRLPIQLLPLPTYASWTNPIEKLWRWARQEVLHLHRWADDLTRLRAEFAAFLAQFASGSQALLQYTGLGLPD